MIILSSEQCQDLLFQPGALPDLVLAPEYYTPPFCWLYVPDFSTVAPYAPINLLTTSCDPLISSLDSPPFVQTASISSLSHPSTVQTIAPYLIAFPLYAAHYFSKLLGATSSFHSYRSTSFLAHPYTLNSNTLVFLSSCALFVPSI